MVLDVVLVEDHRLVREGVRELLDLAQEFAAVRCIVLSACDHSDDSVSVHRRRGAGGARRLGRARSLTPDPAGALSAPLN